MSDEEKEEFTEVWVPPSKRQVYLGFLLSRVGWLIGFLLFIPFFKWKTGDHSYTKDEACNYALYSWCVFSATFPLGTYLLLPTTKKVKIEPFQECIVEEEKTPFLSKIKIYTPKDFEVVESSKPE